MPLAGWNYKTPVTLSNASATNRLSYFQSPITLSGAAYAAWAAHALANGNDLRVVDSDDSTVLPHWVEFIDSANSKVHILTKAPYVEPSGSRVVNVYYGNASAPNTSDPLKVIQPTTAPGAPVDVFTQADFPGYINGSGAVRLKYQTGGNAVHNGEILAVLSAGGTGTQFTNCSLWMMRSTDNGASWTKTQILDPGAGNAAAYRALGERPDGTIVLIYGCDTNANTLSAFAKIWVAKSTDAGATWANLAAGRTNQFATPYVTGTEAGTLYCRVQNDSAGYALVTAYGNIASAGGWKVFLMQLAPGADPVVGSNWTVRGTIYNGPADSKTYNETDFCNTSGTNWVAVARCHTSPFDLMRTTSADNGATWTTPTPVGMPPATDSAHLPVSPWLEKLASGNIAMAYGVRQSTAKWGTAIVISTDNGVSFTDRPACGLQLYPAQDAPTDFGYPWLVQRPDGKIICCSYHSVGSFLTNLDCALYDEDQILNYNNVYTPCQSFDAVWTSHGTQATISSTRALTGANSIKIDNNTGTSNNNFAMAKLWPTTTNGDAASKVAYTSWYNVGTNSVVGQNLGTTIQDTLAANRCNVAVKDTTNALETYNGASYVVSGVTLTPGTWAKVTNHAAIANSSVAGKIYKDNVDTGLAQVQYVAGTAPLQVRHGAGAAGSNNNVVAYYGTAYSHQYAALPTTFSVGSEQAVGGGGPPAASASCLLAGM